MAEHLSDYELAMLATDTADAADRGRLLQHVESCERCKDLLAEAVAAERRAQELNGLDRDARLPHLTIDPEVARQIVEKGLRATRPSRLSKLGRRIIPLFRLEADTDRAFALAADSREEDAAPLPSLASSDGSFLVNMWNWIKPSTVKSDMNVLIQVFLYNLDSYLRTYDAHYSMARYNIKSRLPLIKSPTLALSGSKDFFIDELESVGKAIPRCQTKVLEGEGSSIALESPERFASVILEFLGSP